MKNPSSIISKSYPINPLLQIRVFLVHYHNIDHHLLFFHQEKSHFKLINLPIPLNIFNIQLILGYAYLRSFGKRDLASEQCYSQLSTFQLKHLKKSLSSAATGNSLISARVQKHNVVILHLLSFQTNFRNNSYLRMI